MRSIFDTLGQAKHLSSAEIAALVKDLSTQYLGCAESLRRTLDTGKLFRIGVDAPYESLAVETALMALILANVSLLDPFARSRQVRSIGGACSDLGVSYEDALRLTASEQKIKDILAH